MKYIRTVDMTPEFRSQRLGDPSSGLDTCICSLSRMQPGHVSNLGLHIHHVDQFDYVIQGEMSIRIGREDFKLHAGQIAYIPAETPHNIWNTANEDELHFELICPPPAAEPIATRVDDSYPVPDLTGIELVRTMDEAGFKPERFSSVTLADRSSGVESVSMGVFRVPSGGTGPKLHVHRFDQIYFVLTGTMGLTIGLEEYTAPQYSLVVLPAGMPHTNWNAGSDVEYHLNLRLPQPLDRTTVWDIPVILGEESPRPAEAETARA